MPAYNLTGPQRSILTSWLFEPWGYLDAAINDVGVSARQALTSDPGLDVTVWIRTQTRDPNIVESDWIECGMVWWIRANSGVNITPPTRPPETAVWVATLDDWVGLITRTLEAVSEAIRNQKSYSIVDETGAVSSMPIGQWLVHQRNLANNVLSILR